MYMSTHACMHDANWVAIYHSCIIFFVRRMHVFENDNPMSCTDLHDDAIVGPTCNMYSPSSWPLPGAMAVALFSSSDCTGAQVFYAVIPMEGHSSIIIIMCKMIFYHRSFIALHLSSIVTQFLTIPLASSESRCSNCWDFCSKKWPNGTQVRR